MSSTSKGQLEDAEDNLVADLSHEEQEERSGQRSYTHETSKEFALKESVDLVGLFFNCERIGRTCNPTLMHSRS